MDILKAVQKIRVLIAGNEIDEAIKQLRLLLESNPILDEVILHSGRYQDILKQIRLGVVDFEDAKIEKNQIRKALVDTLRQIELKQKEKERAEQAITFKGRLLKVWREKRTLVISSMLILGLLVSSIVVFGPRYYWKTLKGRVISIENNIGISGAEIVLKNESSIKSITDEKGMYMLKIPYHIDLPYYIMIKKEGYEIQEYPVRALSPNSIINHQIIKK